MSWYVDQDDSWPNIQILKMSQQSIIKIKHLIIESLSRIVCINNEMKHNL